MTFYNKLKKWSSLANCHGVKARNPSGCAVLVPVLTWRVWTPWASQRTDTFFSTQCDRLALCDLMLYLHLWPVDRVMFTRGGEFPFQCCRYLNESSVTGAEKQQAARGIQKARLHQSPPVHIRLTSSESLEVHIISGQWWTVLLFGWVLVDVQGECSSTC